MSGFSNYWRNTLLSHGFGKEIYSAPSNYFVALSTSDPLGDASGISEPSGNGYARVSTASSDWSDVSSFETQNSNAVTFAQATGSWGTITHFAIYDALSGGNMLSYGALSSSVSITSGKTARFNAGDLSVTH